VRNSRYTEQNLDEYFKSGKWDKMTISHIWDRNAEQYPEKQAIEDLARVLTWKEAKTWIDRVALGLVELGIDRDEVLIVQLPNCVELHLIRVACEKAGIICLPVLINMREHEMHYILDYTSAAALVIPSEFRGFNYINMIQKIRQNLPKLKHVIISGDKTDNTALSIQDITSKVLDNRYPHNYLENRRYRPEEGSSVFLTSGTTGLPKFVEYPAACANVGKHFARLLKITGNDVVAAIAPAARGPNLSAYYAAPQKAAKILMLPWFGPKETLKLIEQKRVTVACLVPTQLTKMLQEAEHGDYELNSVRIWFTTGSSLPASVASRVEKEIGGITLNQYGTVDFGAMAMPLPEDDFAVRVSTVGKPRFYTSVKIVNDVGKEVAKGVAGEITGKGPYCSSGYYKDSEATKEAWNEEGWYATGDLGKFDEQGNLVIVGRKKDVIIRGGQNIIPAEIENLLTAHPKVSDVAIVAMPDLVMGEKACAYVVPKNEETLSLEEVTSFLIQKNVAKFKLPERLEVVDKFPMVSDGQKIDKKALAQDIAQKLELERTK